MLKTLEPKKKKKITVFRIKKNMFRVQPPKNVGFVFSMERFFISSSSPFFEENLELLVAWSSSPGS